MSLSRITRDAMEISVDGFSRLVVQATRMLRAEDGKVGELEIFGRLVRVRASGKAVVIGDLHGDLESLVQIIEDSNILKRMEGSRSDFLIFLGDYGDRGLFSSEVYYAVLSLKLQYPGQVVLMRGNHEGPKDLLASPHDLPTQFQARFGENWTDAYKRVLDLFAYLYTCVLVKDRYLIVHGGLPRRACRLEDFAYAHKEHPKKSFLEDMLWSDPEDSFDGTYPSPRGAGQLFGKDVTTGVLKALDVRVLIRGHEPCSDGFKINHDGKVLTLFSRKGPPYFNEHGAYLDVDLSRTYESADQMVAYIHRF